MKGKNPGLLDGLGQTERTLPKGWRMCPFGEAAAIAEGQVDPREEPWASMIHIGPENVEAGTGRLLQCQRASDLGLISGKYLFKTGNIVYSKIRPYLRKSVFVDFDGLCSADMYPLTAKPGIDAGYLHAFTLCEEFTAQATSEQARTGIPKLNRQQLNRIAMPLPRLPEQQVIGKAFLTLRSSLEVQEKIVAGLRELKAATMAKLFREGLRGERRKQTEIGEIPKSWEVVPCESICETISVGIVVTPAKYYVARGIPCFRSFNVREDRLVDNDLVFISPESHELHAKSRLSTGDVLVVRTGYPGTSCVVPPQFEGANCIDLIFARPTKAVLSFFLSRYLNSAEGKKQVAMAQGGLAQQHFNVGALRRTMIALPSSGEQRNICQVGLSLDLRIESAERSLLSLRTLFSSTLHLLMTGQVRVPVGKGA